ncbi:MAG: hypothetical protein IT460_12685 [Planctomycetes bacterium]|nr:hypothetical protein [Planctomycetota bacterium]
MASTRRPFLVWLGDVLCGLSAYTLSRWLWQRRGEGVFAHLGEELATFAGAYVLLKLLGKLIARAWGARKAAKPA